MIILRITALTAFLILSVAAHGQVIYKCVSKGKTVYSEAPCEAGDYENNRFAVRDDRVGNTTYDRQTIEAARGRIRSGMEERGVGVGTAAQVPIGAVAARNASPEARRQQCQDIANRKKELELRTFRRNSGHGLDRLRDQKAQLERDTYDWGC